MNPHIIDCLVKGYERRIQEEDAWQHAWWGTYGVSAITKVFDGAFSKNPMYKYIEDPILGDALLTEEELEDRELAKALLAEEQWIRAGKERGLAETII